MLMKSSRLCTHSENIGDEQLYSQLMTREKELLLSSVAQKIPIVYYKNSITEGEFSYHFTYILTMWVFK